MTKPTLPKFEYKTVPLNKIRIDLAQMEDLSSKERQTAQGGDYLYAGGKMIKAVVIDDEPLKPSSRFWTSLYSRFGINRSFFRFFGHDELFQRISEREANAMIRVCVERSPGGDSRLLAATGTNKPVIIYDDMMEVLQQFRLEGEVGYSNGVITTTHTPRIGASEFKIGGDQFSNKFVLHAPIDGYGQPNFFLSLLRWVCSNGMIGWANAFKTALQLGSGGDNVQHTLRRALEGFTSDEGYAQLRHRFEAAQQSWASLREQQALYKMLVRLQNDPQLAKGAGFDEATGGILSGVKKEDWMKGHGAAVLKMFTGMTGDPFETYFRDPNAMSEKRQRSLPVGCRTYDLLNFATEVASHHVSEAGARTLQAWVGEMISNDFDLEGSADNFTDFTDFFIGKNDANDTRRRSQAGVELED
jgi:hypothetical protein